MAGKRKSGRGFAGQYVVEEIAFWFYDPRIQSVTANQKCFFFYCGLCAVLERRETLPSHWTAAKIGQIAGLDRKTSIRALERLTGKTEKWGGRRVGENEQVSLKCPSSYPQVAPQVALSGSGELRENPLLGVTDDGRIIVYGVKRRHQNLRWKDGDYKEPECANQKREYVAQEVSDKRLRDETRAVGAVSRVGSVPANDWMDEVLAKKVNANQS